MLKSSLEQEEHQYRRFCSSAREGKRQSESDLLFFCFKIKLTLNGWSQNVHIIYNSRIYRLEINYNWHLHHVLVITSKSCKTGTTASIPWMAKLRAQRSSRSVAEPGHPSQPPESNSGLCLSHSTLWLTEWANTDYIIYVQSTVERKYKCYKGVSYSRNLWRTVNNS